MYHLTRMARVLQLCMKNAETPTPDSLFEKLDAPTGLPRETRSSIFDEMLS